MNCSESTTMLSRATSTLLPHLSSHLLPPRFLAPSLTHLRLRTGANLHHHPRRHPFPQPRRPFTCSPRSQSATLNQVRRGCRVPQKARRPVSPALANRPQMKGVCLKVGVTKPKKPNSGERKTARVRLSSGRTITAFIPGEGECCLFASVLV